MGVRTRLGITAGAPSLAARGFQPGRPEVRDVLGGCAAALLSGYTEGLTADDPAAAVHDIPLEPHLLGFAMEGAAAATTVRDAVSLGRARLTRRLLDAAGTRYRPLIHFGIGIGMSRIRKPLWWPAAYLDPMLRWLRADGAGFAECAFGGEAVLRRRAAHRYRCGTRCGIRNQGIGRVLWFTESADPDRLAERIASFPVRHHGDLISGIAFAAVLAGGGTTSDIDALPRLAGAHRAHLAQGAAFAAEVGAHTGRLPRGADAAVRTLAGTTADTAAAWSAEARTGLAAQGCTAAGHETWRARVRELSAY